MKKTSVVEKELLTEPCDTHDHHEHQHGEYCGHRAVKHGNHIDYIHDGHRHRIHGKHVDECEGGEVDKETDHGNE